MHCHALQLLQSDPNFVRLSKGVYSLHCFHPDKEVLVKAPAPTKRKAEDAREGGADAKGAQTILQMPTSTARGCCLL